jgi:hypothetical protein
VGDPVVRPASGVGPYMVAPSEKGHWLTACLQHLINVKRIPTMNCFKDKRLLIHFQAPFIFGAIVGLFLHWNIFQVLSMCMSMMLMTHWLSERMNWGAYETLNNLRSGVIAIVVFLMLYSVGFYLFREDDYYYSYQNASYSLFEARGLAIQPRFVSMIIALLPIGPYIWHLVHEHYINKNDNVI